MMLIGDFRNGVWKFYRSQYPVTDFGVSFYQIEFDMAQLGRLTENFRRDFHLSYIMDHSRHPDAADLLFGKVQISSDRHGQVGNPLLVTGGIRISLFNNHSHRPDRIVDATLQLSNGLADFFFGEAPLRDVVDGEHHLADI